MVKIVTVKQYTCDFCKNEIHENKCIKSIEINRSYSMDLVNTINLDLRCNYPYSGNLQLDICESCFYEMLEEHIKDWRNSNEKTR